MRRLGEANSSCSSDLPAQLNVDELENVSTQKIADAIYSSLQEPLEEYRRPPRTTPLSLVRYQNKSFTRNFPA